MRSLGSGPRLPAIADDRAGRCASCQYRVGSRACMSIGSCLHRVTHWDLRTIRHLDGCGAAAGRGGAMDGVSEVKAGDQRSVASSVYTRTLRRVSAHGSTHVLHRDVEVARFLKKKFAERFRSGQKSNRFEAPVQLYHI